MSVAPVAPVVPVVPGARSHEVESPVRLVDVARADGRVRRLAVLDPPVDASYREAVARVAARVERALPRTVFAERIADLRTLRPSDHRRQRRRFQAEVHRLSRPGAPTALDVAACYASIGPGSVERALVRLGAHPSEAGRIVGILDRFARWGVEGLPIGPPASAVLANAVLLHVDRSLADAGLSSARWVDDVVVAAAPERAVETFAAALSTWGLRPNPAKTRRIEASSPSTGVAASGW